MATPPQTGGRYPNVGEGVLLPSTCQRGPLAPGEHPLLAWVPTTGASTCQR